MNVGKVFVGILLLFFLIKGFYYCLLIPPWEAPDETGHVAYVQYLYQNRKLPDPKMVFLDKSILASTKQQKQLLRSIDEKVVIKHIELFDKKHYKPTVRIENIASNPPLYYLYLLPFYLISLPLHSYWSLLFLRLGSVILGLLSLIFMYKLAKLLFPQSPYIPPFVILLVTLHPMFTFMTAVVNNDNMVIFFFVLFLYLVCRYILFSEKQYVKTIFLIGLVTSFATLAKPQLLILLPLYIFTLIFSPQKEIKKYVAAIISIFLIPIIWYIPKVMKDGVNTFSYLWFHSSHHALPLWRYPIAFIATKQPIGIFMSFWGFFGGLNVPMPKWIYILFLLVVLIALMGWIITIKNKRKVFPSGLERPYIFLYIAAILYICIVYLYDIVAFTKTYHFALQGRYFLPVLVIVSIWIIQGIYFYKPQVRNVFVVFCICVFFISQLLMYITISHFYYHKTYLLPPLMKVYGLK